MKHLFVSCVFWQITVACFGFLHSSLHIPITFTFSLWRAFAYVCASVGGSIAFSRGACICCFCYIYSSDCARDAVFGVKCAFCSAFYVFCGVFIFLQCVLLLFAVCISFFSAFYVFLRCVCLVALHFTVFSVLLTIFFCVPRSFGGAGTGTTRRRNIFHIFFAYLLTNKRVN